MLLRLSVRNDIVVKSSSRIYSFAAQSHSTLGKEHW